MYRNDKSVKTAVKFESISFWKQICIHTVETWRHPWAQINKM